MDPPEASFVLCLTSFAFSKTEIHRKVPKIVSNTRVCMSNSMYQWWCINRVLSMCCVDLPATLPCKYDCVLKGSQDTEMQWPLSIIQWVWEPLDKVRK